MAVDVHWMGLVAVDVHWMGLAAVDVRALDGVSGG